MKGLTNIIGTLLVLLLSFSSIGVLAQSTQEEYLKSNPTKKQFDNNQWGSLKGKMKKESGGSSAGSEGFGPGDYSTEESSEGDNYEYDSEKYKGEFSEHQNFENPENEDYEYDDEYDNYEHQDNYYKNDKKYGDGEYNKYNKPTKPIKKQPSKSPSNSSPNIGSGWVTFLKFLGYLVIGGIIAFVIYYLFVNYKGSDKGAKVNIDFDDVPPTEIPKTELERRLEEALAREDYREAIRIYFIFIIKDLSDKNWINWEKKKTNYSYLIEMRSKSQYSLFEETVSIYDLVWYGNYEITKSDFNQAEPKFKGMLKAIQQ